MNFLTNITSIFRKPDIFKQNIKRPNTIQTNENTGNNANENATNKNYGKTNLHKTLEENNISYDIKQNIEAIGLDEEQLENINNGQNMDVTDKELLPYAKDLSFNENDCKVDPDINDPESFEERSTIQNINNTFDDSVEINAKTGTTGSVLTNEVDKIASKYLNEFIEEEIEYLKQFETDIGEKDLSALDETATKDLNEFDEVLAKLKSNSQLTLKSIALDEIDDVLNLDEYDAYNFQETKSIEKLTVDENISIISISGDSTDIIEKKSDKYDKPKRDEENDKLENLEEDDMSTDSVSSDENGYHSSDFEFITEEEAKMDGLIINFDSKRNLNKDVNDFEGKINTDKFSNDLEIEYKNSMENYVVPEGDNFLKLFEGHNHGLPLSEIRYLEHKCLTPRAPMYLQHDSIGFDMRMMPKNNVHYEYRSEARETLKRITDMFPENGIKRRRELQ